MYCNLLYHIVLVLGPLTSVHLRPKFLPNGRPSGKVAKLQIFKIIRAQLSSPTKYGPMLLKFISHDKYKIWNLFKPQVANGHAEHNSVTGALIKTQHYFNKT